MTCWGLSCWGLCSTACPGLFFPLAATRQALQTSITYSPCPRILSRWIPRVRSVNTSQALDLVVQRPRLRVLVARTPSSSQK
ncbi:hypothetical protein EDB92DRAFT_1898270 [Lactarius akahatsu]|uniref:Secreted protein n=1 Tax=Lactarius akahatsu TaxID=416441 RepID=A0AAD4L5R8_9AGAM|nr:hypothetical protein EDB92DRAFT_1898270 [Lactarius akahatsu]